MGTALGMRRETGGVGRAESNNNNSKSNNNNNNNNDNNKNFSALVLMALFYSYGSEPLEQKNTNPFGYIILIVLLQRWGLGGVQGKGDYW